MIIGCEKCGTKFRLPDDAVKPGGVWVRCSLCRHLFRVYPPGEESSPRHRPEERRAEDRPALRGIDVALARRSAGAVEDFDDFLSDVDEDFLEDELIDARKRKKPGKREPDGGGVRPGVLAFSSREEKKPSFLGRLVKFLLVILVVAAAAGVVIHFWAPGIFDEYLPVGLRKASVEVPDAGASRLVLFEVSGDFVESEAAGSLFVVRGRVRNEYPDSRSLIQLRGSILDEKGGVVLERTAYAGNAVSDEELIRMPPEDVARTMENSYGIDMVNRNVPPGASIPFTIVFENLPENVVEFTVEALGSVPGTS